MSLTRRMIFACEGDWRALSAVWGGEGTPAHKSFEQKACLGSAWTEAHPCSCHKKKGDAIRWC